MMSSEPDAPVSDDEEYDPYSMMPVTKLEALYDYSYADDDGLLISMVKGERYHLIQKEGDWWEVVRDSGTRTSSLSTSLQIMFESLIATDVM